MNSRITNWFCAFLGLGLITGCGDNPAPAPAPEAKPVQAPIPKKKKQAEEEGKPVVSQHHGKIHVLSIGGGSSHDFNKWFGENDSVGISVMADAQVDYTERVDMLPKMILDHDVIYLSANQPLDGVTRQSLMSFADSGHGMFIVHAATWYNWNDWPEYNAKLVGGGTHEHDKYGDFIVTVDDTEHPVMKGMPTAFRVTDELYHFEPDSQGTPIHVLATAKNLTTGKTYPCVWVVQHPKAHILCTTLGHDEATHSNPNFHSLLKNGIQWVALGSL